MAAVGSTSIEHGLSRVLLSDLIAECDQDGTVNLNLKIKKK